MAVVAALAAAGYLYLRIDDETRRIAETALCGLCDPLTARVGSADYASGHGITLRGVELVDPRGGGAVDRVLRIDELEVEGRFDVATLLRERPRVERIVIRRPTLNLIREPDGSWNLSQIAPPDSSGGEPIVLRVLDGAVRVEDRAGAFAPYTLSNVSLSIEPTADGGYSFNASIRGGVASQIRVAGELNPRTGALRSTVLAERLVLTDEIVALASSAFAPVEAVAALRGQVSIHAEVSRENSSAPLRWKTDFDYAQGQVWLSSLRQPFTDVAVAGAASDEGLVVERATAQWGEASIAGVGRLSGWRSDAPKAFRARVENLEVGRVPVALIPSKLMRLRDRFQPTGVVSAEAEVDFADGVWAPRATIRAADASFVDREQFRYRIKGGAGRIDLNGGVEEGAIAARSAESGKWSVSLDLTGMIGDAPVRVSAAFPSLTAFGGEAPVARTGASPASKRGMPTGWIDISAVGAPVDDAIVEALGDEPTKRVLRSLAPRGRVDLRWYGRKDAETGGQFHTGLDLYLAGCAINYEHFPYPLRGVTGWVRQRGRTWTFRDLVSRDASGAEAVTASGELTPAGDDSRLALRLSGVATPLNETLRVALPAYAQQAWEYLAPRGRLDFDAVVTHRIVRGRSAGPPETPDVRLSMRPHQRELVVEPTFTEGGGRYRLERVDGRFDWEDGKLTMRGARADHGRTSFEADGVWETAPGGAWRLQLTRLHADRLVPNHDLLLASPAGLRGVIETLNPRGGFNLFDSSIEVIDNRNGAVTARWDIGLDCHQASIDAGTPIDGVSGVVRLNGSTDGVAAQTAGELDLDSAFWNDLQLTAVRGPFWADGVDCWFGEGACRKTGSEPRRVNAETYGGKVAMNGHVRCDGRTRYGLQTNVEGVDVGRLAAEWMRAPEAIGGRLDGFLEVQGMGASVYGMQGRGALAVSDADLYELPVMFRLLKVLRNRAPDGIAFDHVEAEFDLHGEQIAFKRLDLKGDAVSLYGDGRASLDRELDLTFGSVVGRTDFVVPKLRSLVGQTSEQFLRVRVLGTTDAPEIRREALPMVSSVIEQFQTELRQPQTTVDQAQGAQAPPRRTSY